jgi:hypothetical protein
MGPFSETLFRGTGFFMPGDRTLPHSTAPPPRLLKKTEYSRKIVDLR